jgi:hypothetical protein
MMPREAIVWAAACFAAIVASSPTRAADVDLALVLAVDVSSSVSHERYRLQMDGYAAAFRDAAVIQAIESGPVGAIAVTLVQWAGFNEYRQTIDWAIVRNAETADGFASAILESGRPPGGSTGVSSAIDFSAHLLRHSAHRATRRVIDISGDGSNNNGRPAALARDEAVSAGIIINGLPILTEEPTLDSYFREQVIGGPGAFVIVAENQQSFATAIVKKLLVEIAGTAGSGQLSRHGEK